MGQKMKVRRCPKGHAVGAWFKGDKCTVSKCADVDLVVLPKPEAPPMLVSDTAIDMDAVEAKPQDAEFAAKAALVKLPRALKGDDATRWSQDKMVELLPQAVAEIAWNLRYGNDKQRDSAVDRVLRANGMDRRDGNAAGQGGMIVLNLQTGNTGLPWLDRMKPSSPVVDSGALKGDADGEGEA